MKHNPKKTFTEDVPKAALTLPEVIEQAKETIGAMTSLPVDAIVHCGRAESLNWAVSVDVVESYARMGDNDLLATYEIEMTPAGEMESFSRTRRYHREDRDG